MRDREASDCDQDAAARTRDQHQTNEKQKMVIAPEDVPYPEREVVACHCAETLREGNHYFGFFGGG